MTISDGNNSIDQNEDVFIFPTSYGQKRMWFLDQFEPGSPYYNIPVAFKIKGRFDQKLFIKTINKIVERHESIRTTFIDKKGQPLQVISPELKIDIPIVDLSENEKAANENTVKEIATKEARAPFNISTGPLFRVTIVKLSENENVILITMHHIISDGWSMGVLVGEITSIYSSLLIGKEVELPELEIQYADFSEWQNEYLSGEVLDNQLSYWKNKLGNSNSLLELPTDRSRQAVWTNNGSSIEGFIPAEIIDGLQKLSNSNNATLFMTLVASFNLLLHKYSGQDDINIGTPIANRTDHGIEKIIGLFLNTLVLRTDLSGDPTFTELLKQVRITNLESFEHQDLPFEMLVDEIQPDRNMSYAPLFQVMLILQNNPVNTTKLPGIELSMLEVDMGTATSDITYSISTGKNGASCSIEYNTDLFDEDTILRMFEDYITLLKQIISNPENKISSFDTIDQVKKNKILYDWNSRSIELPNINGIHSLVERWAEKTPNSIAVVDNQDKINYAELNERSNQLAHYLIKNNKNRNLPIGISLDKSVNLLITVLGVLKSGFAYLPLDPTYPEERLNYMIEDSEIELIITDKNNSEIFSTFKNDKIIIEEISDLKELSKENPKVEIHDNDLAYIIYTSGSTGKAKGTMVQHNSLVNIYLGWENDYNLLEVCKNHLQMASFSFDVFGGDWTRALCSGGKLVLVEREQLLEAEKLHNIIINENIDIAEFVPAVLRNLIDYVDGKSLKLDSFKVLIAGSDIWYVKEYNEFKKYCSKDVRLINSFGLTEAAIDSTFFEDDNLNLSDDRLVPIGKPFPNINLYILDPNLNTVPIGVKGELYIGGVSLARGYYKRADLTAERFIPNLYSKTKGDRIYKTGDVARYLPDGNIEFLGRADHQIKLRGFRIELGEIENALSENENIKDAIVIARGEQVEDKRLVAYIISVNGVTADTNVLREFVAERVPDYMVPSAFVIMDEFPLTPNGKVDRKSLPEPDQKEMQNSFEVDYVVPRNETEEVIAKIWEEILKIDSVGINHNFFILGGHSLLATQVISRIKSELQVNLQLRFIFEKPTVEALAEEVERLKLTSNELTDTKIVPRVDIADIPLSFAQERLWFLDQLEPNSPFYNIPESYRLKGEIDFSILEKCFNDIVKRHEILRTYFSSSDGTPSQIIQDSLEIKFPIIDLTLKSEEEKKSESENIIAEETKSSISIDELPLFRIKIIKLSDDDHIFLMTIHHIISDDWSTKVIVQELGVLYESYVKGIQAPLPALSIQYADYSLWQRDWLKGNVLDSHIDYWKNQLSGIPSLLELPLDYPRPKEQTFNGDYSSFELSSDISNKIKTISKEEGSTVFMILLAAFKLLLYKLSGQNDICVGTPSANRNREEIESLIGFFVNTLAIRTDCSNNPTFREFLGRIKESTLGAYAHQDLPFEYIVDTVKPERNLSHSPIFQVMFVYQNVDDNSEERSGNLSIEAVDTHSRTSKFDLTLFMVDSGDEISGAIEFNTDLFSKSTIQNFIEYFKLILDNSLNNISKPISNLKLLGFYEQEKIIKALNENVDMDLFDNLVPKKFSEVAKSNAEKIAIQFNNDQYSFYELEKESNKLANHLIKLGIYKEQIVGICLPRSFSLISSLLGILKAGAAYLPIDPKYPQDRIDYILEDSGARFVITEETYQSLFDENKITPIILDVISDELNDESVDSPKVNIDKNNLCYIIYTSGSTGKPKGTLITHEGLQNYLSWTHHDYPFKQENGSLVHSTISFDATVTSIFPSLLIGKKIVIMEETDELDELAKVINENQKFSIIKITPAHLELLANLSRENKASDIADAMIIGGENLTSKQIKYWQAQAPNTLLLNEYGPTEAVVGCVVFEGSKFAGNGSVPIGKVIPNMQVYVLDKNLSQVPNGVIGELYIGGVSLARGYLNKPNLTAEKFIPNPFTKNKGERIYRTGDLVKILNDGNLIFIGRIDDQVKVRGYRIELGEIESQLNKIDEVVESVVDLKKFGENDIRIVAYIVHGDKQIDNNKILNTLRNDLPEYMLPSNIVEIDKIPLTINGKVDRKKLQVPADDLRNNDVEFVLPSTKTEKIIYKIWSEVLKNDNISIYDNFFDLGGHSLLVTKLAVRIGKHFEITYPIKDVFEFPTIAQISLEIDNGKYQKQSSNLPSIKKYNVKENIPLSFTQRRLWFLDQLDPGQSIYNMPMAMKINGKVDLTIIKKTIDYLADRHETLRTNIVEVNGIPQQIIHEQHKIDFIIENLENHQNDEQNHFINKIKEEEAIRPFDLAMDSLIRFRIATLSDNQFVLFFTMHHIISDGWSVNILLEEFVQTYLALIQKDKVKLPDLHIQYSDFSIWQQKYLVGETLNKQIDYWTKNLEDQPNLLELPLDKRRPINKTFSGSHLSFDIEKETIEEIDQILKLFKITPFMFLMGAFQILLSRLSNQSDISVGTPVANRTQIETEKIIGFFANTLVMRNRVDGNNTLSKFFDQVKNTALGAYQNQDVPFEKLVEILKPERDLGHTPLFQVMFVLQNNTPLSERESDTFVEPLESESTSTQYDLTLSMNTSDDNWSGTLEFNTDLFEINTIKSIIKSFSNILKEISSNNKKFVYELDYLSKDEQKELLKISEGIKQENIFSNVLSKFKSIVNEYPEKTACEFDDKKLTFKELDDKSDEVCSYLIEQGYEIEDVIGVMLPNSLEVPEWILGIMKAGCCYMPIDQNYPKDRIEYMIKDSGVKSIIYNNDSNKIDRIDESVKVINLNNVAKEISQIKQIRTRETHQDNLAYLIYTSGSTGKPKGVMLRHEGLINLVTNQIQDFGITEKSKVLQFASISFDASISELFMSLLSGANLVFVNREKLSDVTEVKNILQQKNITVVTLPPSLMQVMSDDDLIDLKTVISAGEKLNKEVANKWKQNQKLLNAYGPTEATVGVSSLRVQNINEEWNSIPIGSSINNVKLFVLDKNINLVKKGTVGEIFIGGISLARGYTSKPDLTAENFIPNPYAEVEGERLYRTGDLGKYTKDGVIEYVGRIDEQVKVRGFRVELTEIEIVIKSLSYVDEAVVITQGEGNKAKLVAFVKTVLDHDFSSESIKQKLQDKLPDYMVPGIILEINEIPITSSGKIDRKKMPKLGELENISNNDYVAPSNGYEKELVEIWEELLDIKNIGVNDNFFELGGHSLLVTQLVSRINERFDIQFELREVFESPSIFDLAKKIERKQIVDKKYNIPPLLPVDRNNEIPLSFAQQRLWFLDQLEPGNTFYNLPLAVKISGNLSIDIIKESIKYLVSRHEVLRTTFQSNEGKAYQKISIEPKFNFQVINFANEQAQSEEKMRKIILGEFQKTFNLTNGPLLKATIIKKKDNEFIFLLVMHHIISDGWSMSILINEIITIYQSLTVGKEPKLFSLPIQYADYSFWQRGWLKDEILNDQLEYWKQKLSGAPPLIDFPLDKPRPNVQTFNGKTIEFSLEETISDSINKLSREKNATNFMILLAAFKVLLYKYTNQNDIVVGTPVANRNNKETENLIGFFVNTLVLRSNIKSDSSYEKIIEEVRNTALEAYDHQDIPFETVVDTLQPERDLSHSPLFQIMFTLQNNNSQSLESTELKISGLDIDSEISKFDLSVSLSEHKKGFSGSVEYNTDLFYESTMVGFAKHFEILIKNLLANLNTPVKDVSILAITEENKLLYDLNRTDLKIDSKKSVLSLFEEQARKNPNSIAIVDGYYSISYSKLNEKANRIAHYLRNYSTDIDSIVGIHMERSWRSVLTMIATLKAGFTFIPMDPDIPHKRFEYIVKEANPVIILTEEKSKPIIAESEYNIQNIENVLKQTDSERSSNLNLENYEPQNLAYVIYTSGSTGLPKGVQIEHEGLRNLVHWHIANFNLTKDDNSTCLAGPGFDASVWEYWPYLACGASLHIIDRYQANSPEELKDYIINNNISVSFVPTPMAEKLLLLDWSNSKRLRLLLTGGDKLNIYSNSTLPFDFINNYGPTENSVVTTSGLVPNSDNVSRTPHIGRPILNTKIYILDKNINLVAEGVVGELCISGSGLARGYLNRADLTAELFIPNPFSNLPGDRMYKTGDLCRYLPDGNIEFKGRKDFQVKLRGFRIEIGEIETLLLDHSSVKEVTVTIWENESGLKRLVAYLVSGEDQSIVENVLREYLKERLPEYMVPSIFVFLEILPLTSNGKIDKKALPEPQFLGSGKEREYVSATTDDEIELVNIWQNVLNIENIGISDNFFEIGGDSILLIQIVALAKQKGIHFSPRHMFQNPTIHSLLNTIANIEINELSEQEDGSGQIQFTPIQKWFFEHHHDSYNHFNTSMFLELFQEIDINILRLVILKLIEHHDFLRVEFTPQKEGEWEQFIPKSINIDDVPVEFIDLSSVKQRNIKREIEEKVETIQASFDLSKGPLLRVAYFDLGKKRNPLLLLVFHHMVCDGVSWRIIMNDLIALFNSMQNSKPPELLPKSTSVKTWAKKLNQYSQTDELKKEFEYWKSIGSYNTNKLFVDYENGDNTFGSTENYTLSLDRDYTQKLLTDVPKFYGVQVFDILIAALIKSFDSWTKEKRYLIELEGHGREDIIDGVDLSRTVGWFTTIYPTVFNLKETQSINEELSAIRKTLNNVPNHGIGFNMLRYLTNDKNINDELSEIPKPELNFNYLGQFDQIVTSGEAPFKLAPYSMGSEQASYAERANLLYAVSIINGGMLHLRWLYSKNVHKQKTIKKTAKNFIKELKKIINSVK